MTQSMLRRGMADAHEIESCRNAQKRPRPVISCLECRRKKLKCDRTLPCQQCTKASRSDACTYQAGQEPELHEHNSNGRPTKRARSEVPINSQGADSSLLLDRASAGVGVFEALERRVAHLEGVVGIAASSQTAEPPDAAEAHDHDTLPVEQHGLPSRQNVLSAVFPEATSFVRSFATGNGDARVARVAQSLRGLHDALKIIHKPQRSLVAPSDPTEIRHLIPPLTVCQRLTEIYFDNLEHCFRILHRPTFDKQLTEFFDDVHESPDFLPQLVAVVSIAAILGITDECGNVATAHDSRLIRISVKYIEADLGSMSYKRRHSLPALQTKMILLLLRWMRLDRINELWELSGEVLRLALVIGLDRDPLERSESCSPFDAELCRRLWTTVVEQDMMVSILANMPCMVPDFSTRSPKNVHDHDLLGGSHDHIVSKPMDEWTDSLCQCFLAESIKQRLHGCRDLQSTPYPKYNHVLSHTRALEKMLQNLPPTLRFNHRGDSADKAPARLMARMELDITIRRPLMHLYTAFAYANDERDVFAEARAGFLQSCLMVTTYQDFFDPKYSEIDVARPIGYWDFFYNVYRHEVNQAVLGLCLEIKRLAKSSDPDTAVSSQSLAGFSMPSYTKSSMLHAVKDVLEPMTRRISHPGAAIKDLAYLTIIFNSVRLGSPRGNGIEESLEELLTACRLQLEKDQVSIGSPSTEAFDVPSSVSTPIFELNPSWMSMPALPNDFYFSNGIGFDFDAS